jgi:hypothetical protein
MPVARERRPPGTQADKPRPRDAVRLLPFAAKARLSFAHVVARAYRKSQLHVSSSRLEENAVSKASSELTDQSVSKLHLSFSKQRD